MLVNIKEICNEIDQIIAGKNNPINFSYMFLYLDIALTKKMKISYSEIDLICKTIVKIAKTKNRKIRSIEKDFWNFIMKTPFYLIMLQGIEISENEELLANTEYDKPTKRILSRLLGLVQEIIELKDDKSKASDFRRANSLKFLAEMTTFYRIPFAKNIFVNSINSKNKSEQYEALRGLENYYEVTEDEIEDDLVDILDVIMKKTDDRSVASTCLQIQIKAGIIDEMEAVLLIDDWKEDYYD